MKKLLLFLSITFLSVIASANIVFSPGLSYLSSDVDNNGATSESSNLRADVRLGYVMPMGLYLGGMYAHLSNDSGSSDSSGSLIGPTVGYSSMMGFYTLLTYHIIGEVGDTTKFTGGKGPQIDIGWVFPLSSGFAIGPQFTYRSISFDKVETGGVSTDTDYTETTIAPYLSLWFMF